MVLMGICKNDFASSCSTNILGALQDKGTCSLSLCFEFLESLYLHLKHFEDFGSVHTRKSKATKTKSIEAAVYEVKTFLQENPTYTLRKAAHRISLSKTTMWKIVRHDLKKCVYHYALVHSSTDADKAQRRELYQWILEQPSELVERIMRTNFLGGCARSSFQGET